MRIQPSGLELSVSFMPDESEFLVPALFEYGHVYPDQNRRLHNFATTIFSARLAAATEAMPEHTAGCVPIYSPITLIQYYAKQDLLAAEAQLAAMPEAYEARVKSVPVLPGILALAGDICGQVARHEEEKQTYFSTYLQVVQLLYGDDWERLARKEWRRSQQKAEVAAALAMTINGYFQIAT